MEEVNQFCEFLQKNMFLNDHFVLSLSHFLPALYIPVESTCASVAESNISITNFTFDPLCSLVCPPYNAKVYNVCM